MQDSDTTEPGGDARRRAKTAIPPTESGLESRGIATASVLPNRIPVATDFDTTAPISHGCPPPPNTIRQQECVMTLKQTFDLAVAAAIGLAGAVALSAPASAQTKLKMVLN